MCDGFMNKLLLILKFLRLVLSLSRGAVASLLARSSPERAVRVREQET